MEQTIDVKTSAWTSLQNSFRINRGKPFDWHRYDFDREQYPLPIINPSPKSDKHLFDEINSSFKSKRQTTIRPTPIRDYFKSSIFSCLTCFWMIGGIVCLIQSIKIRRWLRENQRSTEEIQRLSNRLYTNLLFTYVIGGMIIGILILTVFVTFIVGIKGYFSRSL